MLNRRVTLPAAAGARTGRVVQSVLPSSSFPGARGQEGAGRLINCYAEPLGPGARGQFSRRRVPGLASFGTSAQTVFRGMIDRSGVLYCVFDGVVWKTTSAGGALTSHGSLSGSDKCTLAKNNNATPDVVAVDPVTGAFVITAGTVSAYPDADVGAPNSVCAFYGYFVFGYGDGKLRSSALNGTSINTNDFVTAEARPDSIVRPVPLGDILYAFGATTIELLSGTNINLEGFPFTRIGVLPLGLKGRNAVTGHEDGSGMTRLFFVGSDNSCYLISGASYEKISPPDVDRDIAAVTDADDIEAGCYVAEGQTVVVLSGPTFSWEYRVGSNKWNERGSHSLERWRGTQPYFAFSKWLCGDYQSGNILEIDADTEEEAGNPLTMSVISAPAAANGFIARVDVDITTGVGVSSGDTSNERTPTCEISVSTDGGASFGYPQIVEIGEAAIYRQRVFATRFGRSTGQGAVVRIDVSDQVDVGILGAEITVAP